MRRKGRFSAQSLARILHTIPNTIKSVKIMQPKTTKILIPILAILFRSATVDANARKIRREMIYNEIYGSAEMIDGMYIPKNVKEAVEEIDKILTEEEKERLKEDADNFGHWAVSPWAFHHGSRLYRYLSDKVYLHPEDGTEYILIQYLRHLNGKEVVEPATMKMSQENRDRIKELKKSTGKGNPDFWKYNHGSPDYKKSMVGMGLKKGTALKFKYPFGFTTPEEESRYKSQGGETAVYDGVITDVNYEWGYIKVKLAKTVSPYGIIIFDGTQKPVGQKYIEADYKRLSRRGENRYFMKVGEEIWFFFRQSYTLWEVCGEAL